MRNISKFRLLLLISLMFSIWVSVPTTSFAGNGQEGEACSQHSDCETPLQCWYIGGNPPSVCGTDSLVITQFSANPITVNAEQSVSFAVSYSGGIAAVSSNPYYWLVFNYGDGTSETIRRAAAGSYSRTKSYTRYGTFTVTITIWYGPNVGVGQSASRSVSVSVIPLANGAQCSSNTSCQSGYCNNASPRVCAIPPTECSDGVDNDGDTLVDYPSDTGCSNASDTTEGLNAAGTVCSTNSQCQSGLYCNNANPRVCALTPGAPVINSFDANPNPLIAADSNTTLSWSTTNVVSCSVSPNCSGPNNTAAAGSCQTDNLTNDTTYTLTCVNAVAVSVSQTRLVTLDIAGECEDGSDNDGDSLIDYDGGNLGQTYRDTGCTSDADPLEDLNTNGTACTASNQCISNNCQNGICSAVVTGCGNGPACTGGQVCKSGQCVFLGGCGNGPACTGGLICDNGSCVPNQGGGNPPLTTTIPNPLGTKDIYEFLVKMLKAFVNLLIPIIVLFYVIAGLMFVTSRGNPAKLTVAKQAFFYTTIGTAVVLGAWVLAQVIKSTIDTIQH